MVQLPAERAVAFFSSLQTNDYKRTKCELPRGLSRAQAWPITMTIVKAGRIGGQEIDGPERPARGIVEH